LRINPKGQVPVLVHGNLDIFDSTQIFEYLEDLQPAPALWLRVLRRSRAARVTQRQMFIFTWQLASVAVGRRDRKRKRR
jgi:glutathione S-transferase